jgi:dynein assembly factor 2
MSKQFGTGSASREAEKRRDTRPSALVLRVHLPKLDSVAAAELDVGDSRVFFRVPGKYKLDLALPYEVFGDEGRAKFDKAARKLEVTLPVRPAPRAPAPAFAEPVETIADSAEARDEAVPPDAVNPAAAPDDAEARAAASAAAAVAAAAAFDAQGETENQRRWREAHEAREKEAREKETDEARASASNAAATNGDEREDDDATPFSVGDEKASSSEIGAAKKSAAAATFLRPSLRGAAELGDELD